MSSKPSRVEVQAEIDALERLRPTVVQYDDYGDDNWAEIDGSLEVLRGNPSYQEMDDALVEDDYNRRDGAYDAWNWLNYGSRRPSEGWIPLEE